MHPVVHFELPSSDRKRSADFYAKAFGWNCIPLGADNNDYTLVQTSETDAQGMLQKPGRINGGIYVKKELPKEHPSLVIATDDLEASIKAVKDAGGTVLGDPVNIPGYGMYVSFLDTEGNRLSMMQPTKEWQEKTA